MVIPKPVFKEPPVSPKKEVETPLTLIESKIAALAALEAKRKQGRFPPAYPQLFPGIDPDLDKETLEDSASKKWYYKDDSGVEQVRPKLCRCLVPWHKFAV